MTWNTKWRRRLAAILSAEESSSTSANSSSSCSTIALETSSSTSLSTTSLSSSSTQALETSSSSASSSSSCSSTLQMSTSSQSSSSSCSSTLQMSTSSQSSSSSSTINLSTSSTSLSSSSSGVTANFCDACVDAAGGGDYTTLAAAESGITAPATVCVKSGTYAGATLAKAAHWIFEPGVIITSEIQVDTAVIGLEFMSGADFLTNSALIDWNANDGWLRFANACSGYAMDLAGTNMFVDGGGRDSIFDTTTNAVIPITEASADCIVADVAADITSAGGGAVDAVNSTGARANYQGLKIVDSDIHGIVFATGGDGLMLGGQITGSDSNTIRSTAARTRIYGNYGDEGHNIENIECNTNGDDSVIVANHADNSSASEIRARSGANDVVAVGNRCDGSTLDSDGSGTFADNDTDAY